MAGGVNILKMKLPQLNSQGRMSILADRQEQVVVVPVLIGVPIEVTLVTVPVNDERVVRAWL